VKRSSTLLADPLLLRSVRPESAEKWTLSDELIARVVQDRPLSGTFGSSRGYYVLGVPKGGHDVIVTSWAV
jgi:hypothetical protein